MNNYQFKKKIKEQARIDEQKYDEGFRYKVQYFDGKTNYFKGKPTQEQEKNAIMISNLLKW